MIQICQAHTEKDQRYKACKRTAKINQANAKGQKRKAHGNQNVTRQQAEQHSQHAGLNALEVDRDHLRMLWRALIESLEQRSSNLRPANSA